MEPVKRRTRQHRSGNSFSVRLPREMAYPVPDQPLEIEMRGDERVIRPAAPERISAQEFVAWIREHGGVELGPEAWIRPEPENPWDKHRK
jgi:virulence-associated protein VagC